MIGIQILRIVLQVWDRCVARPFSRIWPKDSGKKILCFGDSNTWGAKPQTGLRYRLQHRWPGVLQQELGQGFCVLEEGRKGRTTVLNDPQEWGANGKTSLLQCLKQNECLDLVIILLGTNDLKAKFNCTSEQIAEGVEELGRLVLSDCRSSEGTPPTLLIISPPVVVGEVGKVGLFEGADAKSGLLAEEYRLVAHRLGCEFFDAGRIIQSSIDGVHWDQEAHLKFGRDMAKRIRKLISKERASS